MSTQWHYADRHNQQQGPVPAEWIQAAFARGEIDRTTLVWREGMAGWKPLMHVAAELGIATASVAAPPAPPRAPTATLSPSRRGTPAWVIVLIIVGAMVPVLGILAAIAIPAYQEYTVRAKVSQGIVRATALKPTVESVLIDEGRCATQDDDGVGTPESYADGMALRSITLGNEEGECSIVVAFDGVRGVGTSDTLTLRYDGTNWTYRSTLPPRTLPPSIRNEVMQVE